MFIDLATAAGGFFLTSVLDLQISRAGIPLSHFFWIPGTPGAPAARRAPRQMWGYILHGKHGARSAPRGMCWRRFRMNPPGGPRPLRLRTGVECRPFPPGGPSEQVGNGPGMPPFPPGGPSAKVENGPGKPPFPPGGPFAKVGNGPGMPPPPAGRSFGEGWKRARNAALSARRSFREGRERARNAALSARRSVR